MSIARMREAIIKVYPHDTWKLKVDRMGDNQVIAIYYHFLETGKFDQKIKPVFTEHLGLLGEQLSFDDILAEA